MSTDNATETPQPLIAVGAQVDRGVRPRAWWVAKAGSPEDGCAWTNQPTELDLATMRATTGCDVEVTELGDVAALKAMLVPLLLLAQEVRLIDAHGTTPDGDGVNGPTALWAEDWTRRLAVDAGPNVGAKLETTAPTRN
jgi:hypothetical protein